ncbi:MAG TPA: IS256 family transposase [Solirubrobacterales bacterium]|nr:IS256 family transposase [Solirubrobacterales bacterium]
MPKHTQPTLPADAELALPEQVTIALAELAGAAREGLLALAVGTGLGVLGSLLAADVERLAGPKGRHQPGRAAVRHGTQPGRVTLGGRRIRVDRPRVRSADGAHELPLPTWQAFTATELLDQLTLERMLAKLSTRRYQVGLEPVGSAVEQAATGTSKSAVSRRFVAATEHALGELLAANLSGLDLVALMVDGVKVAEHTCVVALGITLDGTKVPLGLAEGATENATVVRELLVDLRERGLETARPTLCVIDGAKALRRAISDVFDHPILQRCQLHKLRNVTDRLPNAVASTVAKRMRAAYHHTDPLIAQAELEALAHELDRSHPGAAASLREGLAETLTILRLGVPPTLARTLRSTNSVESMIAICRDHAANVKRWRDGQMVLRWIAAGMGEAAKQFRRVNGYLHLPALRAALDATITAVTPSKEDAAA